MASGKGQQGLCLVPSGAPIRAILLATTFQSHGGRPVSWSVAGHLRRIEREWNGNLRFQLSMLLQSQRTLARHGKSRLEDLSGRYRATTALLLALHQDQSTTAQTKMAGCDRTSVDSEGRCVTRMWKRCHEHSALFRFAGRRMSLRFPPRNHQYNFKAQYNGNFS